MSKSGTWFPLFAAVIFRDPSTPIEFTDGDLAGPKRGEVRVQIAAAGVCHSDLHVKRGDWETPAPLVMGHEGAGVVVALTSLRSWSRTYACRA